MRHSLRTTLFSCILSTLALQGLGAAQPQPRPQSGYRELSTTFFQFLEQDKVSEGIDFLFETNPSLKQTPEKAEQLKARFASLQSRAGAYVTHSLLIKSRVAGMYVYEHYFVAYERQPISLRITYYRRDGIWVCQSLKFDTEVDDLLEKTADSQIRTELEFGVR